MRQNDLIRNTAFSKGGIPKQAKSERSPARLRRKAQSSRLSGIRSGGWVAIRGLWQEWYWGAL